MSGVINLMDCTCNQDGFAGVAASSAAVRLRGLKASFGGLLWQFKRTVPGYAIRVGGRGLNTFLSSRLLG